MELPAKIALGLLATTPLLNCNADAPTTSTSTDAIYMQSDAVNKPQRDTLIRINDTLGATDASTSPPPKPDIQGSPKSVVCPPSAPNLMAVETCPEDRGPDVPPVGFGCVDVVLLDEKRCDNDTIPASAFRTCPSGEGGCASFCLDSKTGEVDKLGIACDSDIQLLDIPECPEDSDYTTECEATFK